MSLVVKIIEGGKKRGIYELNKKSFRIGRESDNDIVFNHDQVSRYHAELRIKGGKWFITDKGGRNGTWVNNEKLSGDESPISAGDEISIAKTVIMKVYDSEGIVKKIDMSQKWYFRKEKIEYGPVESSVLMSLAKSGKITKTTLVKLDETDGWINAEDVEGLFKKKEEPKTPPPVSTLPAPASFSNITTQITAGEIVVCPHCWDRFSIENMLFISRHTDLRGDTVLGQDEQLRFLPSRFTPDGHAIDANGMVCPDMACHKCHLRIPESVVDLKSMFFSVVGAPASGKSYFLTSMIWQARKILPSIFSFSFADADVVINQVVNGYEQLLYLNSADTGIVALPKTELQGALYHQIKLNGMIINLPMPFIFKLQPMASHPEYAEKATALTRNLILYDNAGEHFQPGADSVTNPATKHLVHSNGLIFLFDPSKDARMRRKCNPNDPQLKDTSKLVNQETLLSEMISRIRRYGGMKTTDKYKNPLIVVVAKYDMWKTLLHDDIENLTPWIYDSDDLNYNIDYNIVANVSYHLRSILLEICPEIVTTAEAFATKVLFVPVSSIGNSPEEMESGGLGVRPDTIKPVWSEVPLLLQLASLKYLTVKKTPAPDAVNVDKFKLINDTVVFSVPNTNERIQLPSVYWGTSLFHVKTGKWLIIPSQISSENDRLETASDDFWDN